MSKKLADDITNGRNKDYQLREGIVYKKEGTKLLLVIPEDMEESLMFKFHNDFGHFGTDKVTELIRRGFYFTRMRQKVFDHIKKCISCIRFNPKNKKFDGNLHIYEKGNLPFHTLHIDHVGPLEKTKSKNLHIFGVVDGFTKFIKLYPTKTTSTIEVIKWLKQYFENYSKPYRIVSDRGTCFTSKVFREFLEQENIVHVLNATASPQANGQIERYNRTVIPILSKMVSDKKQQWDKLLANVEMVMNNTWNRAIKDIPSKLLFGIVQNFGKINDLSQYMNMLNLAEDRDLDKIRDDAKNNILVGQLYNKKQHDKHCKNNTVYKENDLVMIRNVKVSGEAGKLQPKFKGPYRVKTVLDKNRYIVEDVPGFQISNIRFEGIFDPLNMRLYQPTQENLLDEISSDDEND